MMVLAEKAPMAPDLHDIILWFQRSALTQLSQNIYHRWYYVEEISPPSQCMILHTHIETEFFVVCYKAFLERKILSYLGLLYA